jgi:hypothetical protein
MLVMTFAHAGIERLRAHQEHASMRDPAGELGVSQGFDDGALLVWPGVRGAADGCAALAWFRERFFKCSDRVALVKTWLPAQSDSPAAWLYPLVYERALLLVRSLATASLHALIVFAESDCGAQGAARSGYVTRRVPEALRGVALAAVHAAGRPLASGQPVRRRGPRHDRHLYAYPCLCAFRTC